LSGTGATLIRLTALRATQRATADLVGSVVSMDDAARALGLVREDAVA
jgi:hypothetical protein